MFGFLKPKAAPLGPYEFNVAIEVAAPVEEVYRLLDFSDPANAEAQRGAAIEPLAGAPGRFRMRVPQAPDLDFHIDVLEAEAPNFYSYAIVADPHVGRLASSIECHTVSSLPDGGCRIQLVNLATFKAGFLAKHVEEEVARMTLASVNSLAKLKMQAEQGVEALFETEMACAA